MTESQFWMGKRKKKKREMCILCELYVQFRLWPPGDTHAPHNPTASVEDPSEVWSCLLLSLTLTHQAETVLNVCHVSLTLCSASKCKGGAQKSDRGFFQRLTIWLAFCSIYSLLYWSMGDWLSFFVLFVLQLSGIWARQDNTRI